MSIENFCLPDQTGTKVCLKDFKGKWIVLYFYPKDSTSG
jgi:peroxiredoxin Q/BCP